MNKDVGRLDLRDIKETDLVLQKIYKYLDKDKPDKAKSEIVKLLDTPNYFVREFVGKRLLEYHDGEKMNEFVLSLLGHKIYGVRAATVFYYYLKYQKTPGDIMNLLNMSWNDTPWETEQVIHEMWIKHPNLMKEEMLTWADSPYERQKTLAYHGIEAIASSDPIYIIKLIEKNLDDPSIEVQKKISNILTHVIKAKPAETYSFLREWLTQPSDQRTKTIYIAMKKLISIAYMGAVNKNPKNDEFVLLTMQTINDWKADPDRAVASVGEKLVSFSKNPSFTEQEN
jgi:3-methyladenine DNA glycosylase AlkC